MRGCRLNAMRGCRLNAIRGCRRRAGRCLPPQLPPHTHSVTGITHHRHPLSASLCTQLQNHCKEHG
eukprot:111474-Rhodomonas_salina.1